MFVCLLAATLISVAVLLYCLFVEPALARARLPGQPTPWFSLMIYRLLDPGNYIMVRILPWQYTVMTCEGCEPRHRELVVWTVAIVSNILVWTVAAFTAIVAFRYTRKKFRHTII